MIFYVHLSSHRILPIKFFSFNLGLNEFSLNSPVEAAVQLLILVLKRLNRPSPIIPKLFPKIFRILVAINKLPGEFKEGLLDLQSRVSALTIFQLNFFS